MALFTQGQTIIVVTRGPGKLHLLSYQSNNGSKEVVGSATTTSAGITRFVVGFSHYFTRFAFIWDGEGEATYSVGNGLQRLPVGKSWNHASLAPWGGNEITTEDVSKVVPNAVNRDERTTCFVIPDTV
ncbi:hypothetical protein VKT23_017594 [Stygiomarasmius scandens]|uniref:Uncharacterized protein n=1 Tax=Marasmiellus scandens TaxID=2682957 RepID=A0ABR1IRP1_9AGAR